MFPKLNWIDRIALMEACTRFELPFADKVQLKVALQLLLDPYYSIVLQLGLEPLIALISSMHTWCLQQKSELVSQVELWGKLQLCLIQSFALKNGEFGELVDAPGLIEYQALMMLVNILT